MRHTPRSSNNYYYCEKCQMYFQTTSVSCGHNDRTLLLAKECMQAVLSGQRLLQSIAMRQVHGTSAIHAGCIVQPSASEHFSAALSTFQTQRTFPACTFLPLTPERHPSRVLQLWHKTLTGYLLYVPITQTSWGGCGTCLRGKRILVN